MIFFTSDTHLGHYNIIRYCNRPFQSAEEMDEVIVSNWNKVVNSSDTVYHLGDFAFRDPKLYRERLNGHIVLIRGNHDFKRLNKSNFSLFESVHDLLSIKIENMSIMLCHYAMRVWDKSHFNCWHLYGHSHGTLSEYGKSYDVGVDSNCYTPISFEQLKAIMTKKPDNPNWLKKLQGYREEEFQEAKKKLDQGEDLD
jgi:calcineurin-like phosphoesterase family protein